MRSTALLLAFAALAACTDHRAGRVSTLDPAVAAVAFRTRQAIPLQVERSVDVELADLDGDGVTDLAAADLAGRVVVRLGLGQGDYAEGRSYPVWGIPLAVAAADLNGDGAIDLSLVGARDDEATILLNQGDGTFVESQHFDVQALPTGMVIGDYTADGLPDLIVSHLSRSDLLLFAGNGDGTFGSAVSIDLPRGTRTAGLSVADVDADGQDDVLVCDVDNDQVVVRFGGTTDSGTRAAIVPVGGAPVGIGIGDLDADGAIDIAVSCFGASRIDLIRHIGSGELEVYDSVPVGGHPANLAIGDLDGDSFQDVAVCVLDLSAVSIYLGTVSGLSHDESQLPATGFPYRPLIADVLGGARVDLAVVSTELDRMYVYANSSDGLVSARTLAVTAPRPEMVTAADFDGDGQDEIAAVGSGSGLISIVESTRDQGPQGGSLPPMLREVFTFDVGRRFSNIGSGDVDGDGRPDLLLATVDGLGILANETTAGVLAFRAVTAGGSDVLVAGSIAASLEVADVTRDGLADVVVTFFGDNRVVVLPGTAEPFVFGPAVSTDVPGGPLGLAVADFDRDGRLELAVSRTGAALVSVFAVNDDGQLETKLDVPVGPSPTYLRTADFDADGRADLAVSSSEGDRLEMLVAVAGGGFRLIEVETGRGPTALLAEDLDLDGFPDVLLTTLSDTSFEVILSDGFGGVRDRVVFPGVYAATSAVLADVSGSDLPDLVIGSAELLRLTSIRNDSVRLEK